MAVNRSVWAVALALGCGPRVLPGDEVGEDDGDSETGATGTSGTTSATTIATTTGPVGTSSSTGTGGTTGTTTTGATTGGTGCAEDSASGCASYCALFEACYGEPAAPCMQACLEEMSQDPEPCQQAICELYACWGANDCESFESGNYDCSAQEDAMTAACPECGVGTGRTSCFYSCSNDPAHQLQCNATECACFENDMVVATCPIANACADPGDSLPLIATECCGW